MTTEAQRIADAESARDARQLQESLEAQVRRLKASLAESQPNPL